VVRLVFALVFPAVASAKFVFFQTPSHNIGCVYSSSPTYVRCDIRSGLKPPPAKPKGCMNDWTFGYSIDARGPAHRVCAGDTVFLAERAAGRLRNDVEAVAFACKSTSSGLRCKNRSGHGFFLSRRHSYRF
jgi:Family of unknown function (DUF6636)